jgi:hypothetical protein
MLENKTLAKARNILERYNQVEAVKLILDNQKWWDDIELQNDLIRNQLFAIAATEKARQDEAVMNPYSNELYKDVYAVLMLFAKRWPRNNLELDGDTLVYTSPISTCKMDIPICTGEGYQYDLYEIADLLKYGKNPTSRNPLLCRDVMYLNARATIQQNNNMSDAEKVVLKNLEAELHHAKRLDMIEEYVDHFVISTIVVTCLATVMITPLTAFVSPFFALTLMLVPLITSITSYIYVDQFYLTAQDDIPVDVIADSESLINEAKKEESENKSARALSTAVIARKCAIKLNQPANVANDDTLGMPQASDVESLHESKATPVSTQRLNFR